MTVAAPVEETAFTIMLSLCVVHEQYICHIILHTNHVSTDKVLRNVSKRRNETLHISFYIGDDGLAELAAYSEVQLGT